MKKLLLIVLGGSTLVSIVLIFAFRAWVGKVNQAMPSEGKALFARVDPEKCSAQNCAACAPDQCEAQGCQIREYQWSHGDQGYTRAYCESAAAASPSPSPPAESR
jgi:hypothetical protein